MILRLECLSSTNKCCCSNRFRKWLEYIFRGAVCYSWYLHSSVVYWFAAPILRWSAITIRAVWLRAVPAATLIHHQLLLRTWHNPWLQTYEIHNRIVLILGIGRSSDMITLAIDSVRKYVYSETWVTVNVSPISLYPSYRTWNSYPRPWGLAVCACSLW